MTHYKNDPRWMKAKFDSIDSNGKPVKKGEQIFYYPLTKTVLTGDAADKASADFACNAQDEDFMTGGYY